MLETIKAELNNTDIEPFNVMYYNYIMDVQDRSINMEMDRLRRRNVLDVPTIDILISDTLGGMNNIGKF